MRGREVERDQMSGEVEGLCPHAESIGLVQADAGLSFSSASLCEVGSLLMFPAVCPVLKGGEDEGWCLLCTHPPPAL